MCNSSKKVTSVRHGFLGATLCLALLPACSGLIPPTWHSSRTHTSAMLAAARTNRISMFGDIDGARESTYFTRSAVSLKRHTFAEAGADFDPNISASGKTMVFASTRHNLHPDLYIKAIDGVAVTQLTSDPASDIHPVFSPDGTRVAFASDRSGTWDIWVMGIGGGPPMQITDESGDEVHPSWSPDGKELVYCSMSAQGGQWELWMADVGIGASKRFIGYGLFPEWSPVDNTIVFQRARERGSRWFGVWSIKLVDGEPRFPTELVIGSGMASISPTWSGDGRQVAFVGASSSSTMMIGSVAPSTLGIMDIWMVGADGRGKIRLTNGYTANYSPTIAPSGRIFFTSNRSGGENIWSIAPVSSSDGVSSSDVVTFGWPAEPTKRENAVRTASDGGGS